MYLYKKMLVAGAVLAMGGVVACGEDVAPLDNGSVSLTWDVSPKGCKDSGVTEVEVALENSYYEFKERFLCEKGQAQLGSIYPGNYRLNVSGFDKSAQVTFAAAQKSVTVRGAKIETVGHVRLTAKPASVEVAWLFDNGRVCGANDVEKIDVIVFDDKGYEVASSSFGCNDGSGVVKGIPAGKYVVEVSAQVGGKTAFEGQSDVELDRGEAGQVDVKIKRK